MSEAIDLKIEEATQMPTNNAAPAWLNLQNVLSIVTLLALIVGFFVQNAQWQERLSVLQRDFESFKTETKLRQEEQFRLNTEMKTVIIRMQTLLEVQDKQSQRSR